MNDVRGVECTGTCRIRVLSILRASPDIVEIFKLMGSFDALLRSLVLSTNERDDVISAGIPGQCE